MPTVQQNPQGSSILDASCMVLANSSMATHSRIDFATHQAKHILIMVDVHSKCPEVIDPM